MGRPGQIRDEDVDAELPSDQSGFLPSAPMRAHITLATIMGRMVSHVFRGTRRRRAEDVDDVLQSLNSWKENLPAHLQLRGDRMVSTNRSIVLLHLLRNQVCFSSRSLLTSS
jgi:hypothetical protein